MKTNKLKLVILGAIALFGISFSTNVHAMEYFKGELPISGGKLNPFGSYYTCIERHGSLKPTLTRGTLGSYSVGQKIYSWCSSSKCISTPEPPWKGVLTTAYYEVGGSISYYAHQDAAYIIAESTEKGSLLSTELRDAIWSTDLNIGTTVGPNGLGQEAAAYKDFFEKTHAGSSDIYMSLVHDNTNEAAVKVGVNQDEETYTVGPFKIEYPEGSFGSKNFSYINKIEAVTDAGTLPVTVLGISGNTDKNGGSINTPKSNEEFYIKFKSTKATRVSVKATFTYLEHCEADMYEVNGRYKNWEWKVVSNGEHTHKRTKNYSGPCGKSSCNETGSHSHDVDKDYTAYSYQLTKTDGGKIQLLMKYAAGKKVWKENQYIITTGIDLTMDIAGYVFLDQDEGKVNEGNNLLDSGEGLPGVEVILYDASGNKVSAGGKHNHVHVGDKVHGGVCYSQAVYHTHKESCYVYNHIHKGNSVDGGAGTCYGTPVYHVHDYTCLNAAGAYICGMTTASVEYYALTCNQSVTKTLICGKEPGKTIDSYKLTCNITEGDSYSYSSMRLTDSNGHYQFTKLNAMKKYYVEFIYNGMLYTDVEYNATGDRTSKSTEEGQGHNTNRQTFNNRFAEIASYPNNYYSPSRGAYNKVFLQEEIADTFKTIASNFGSHGNTDEEVYAYDCRISAYSVKQYPIKNVFAIEETGFEMGDTFPPIYEVDECQKHVNLGIKARPTFDLAIYKDVLKATLNINEKQEVYTYDARKDWQNKGFSYGVKEEYYLNELRDKYINGTDTDITTTELIDEGQYSHEYRTEEIINGNNTNSAYTGWLQNNLEYEKTLYGEDGSNKNYAWRDINHGLSDADKLQIHVTYKLAIRNQSSVIGSITEIVDYYDSHYQFESAYVGDENGNEISGTKVDVSETSMYGEATRMGIQNYEQTSWKVAGVNEDSTKYKTLYLRPTEQKLYKDNTEQYIYVTFGLIDPEKTLIEAGLPSGKVFYTYNMAEINGYKTYGTFEDGLAVTDSLGLVDRDSNPGNFNPQTYVFGQTALEDDTSRAPAYAYSIRQSRTLEGNVFEDALSEVSGNKATGSKDEYEVKVNTTRFGDGNIGTINDVNIAGVKVDLVEIKNGKLVVRQTTYTDSKGWYGFGAFLPGDYTIRFTYGADDQTALTKDSQYKDEYISQYKEAYKTANGVEFKNKYGLEYNIINSESYNGQDYQSTIFETKTGESVSPRIYEVDDTLINIYAANNSAKNSEESNVDVSAQVITKYERDDYYWFDDASIAGKSDAEDNGVRRSQVNAYAKSEYTREITNHKAEVFNSYINQATLRNNESAHNKFNDFTQAQPMDEGVDTETKNRALVDELERRTYMYAYTPEINVEVEYTTKTIEGNQASDKYTYKITGVDFGVVERPRTQLTMDQDVKHIKVIASDGTTLLEIDNKLNGTYQVIVDNGNNYQWLKAGKVKDFDEDELINIILDDELLSGAKLEVTYNIEVTNNSEASTGTTAAKTIINYVANNLNFDLADNNGLWEAVKKQDIQTDEHSTYINNAKVSNVNLVDLRTQTTVLKATTANPLTKALAPGESATSTLTLKKTLSAESSDDDLKYANLTEIVEIDNTVGRYDHGAIPGNQSLEEQPREHDTSGASRYDETGYYEPDGEIIITPPTGSKYIYYVLPITLTAILAIGIILIKKIVLPKK